MKIEEIQKQVESVMPTPKQIVENMDKKLEEERERIVYNILSKYAKDNGLVEDKQLLLQDLCSRLPYKVICKVEFKDDEGWKIQDMLLKGVFIDECYFTSDTGSIYSKEFKPYLRPMSSMTEEETEEYRRLQSDIWKPCGTMYYDTADSIDWLNAHHFDYHYVSGRGYLIDAGLALEAPEGIYD